MSDTRAASAKRQAELFSALSGAQRLALGCAMFDDAKAIALAGLRAQNPSLGGRDLKRELFRRLYGRDLEPGLLARILGSFR